MHGTFAKNNSKNAQVFQQHNTKLYKNIFDTKYDKTVIDKIEDGQTKNKQLGITPTRNEVGTDFKKWHTKEPRLIGSI